MPDDLIEALGDILDDYAGGHLDKGGALDAIRDRALEPANVERAAKAHWERDGHCTWMRDDEAHADLRLDMRAALRALLGGSDGQ